MNDDYVDKVGNAADNEVITLDSTSNPEVKKDVFDQIRGTNKTLILVNDGIQWIFKGPDIKNPTKNINTKIKISKLDAYGNEMLIDCFSENSNGLVIEFAPNGTLPGRALVKIKADYTFRNYIGEKDLYVYHFQGSGNSLEAIAERIEMTSDGYYQFYITHNSRYIISSKKAKVSSVSLDNTSLNKEFTKDLDSSEQEALDLQGDKEQGLENNKEYVIYVESADMPPYAAKMNVDNTDQTESTANDEAEIAQTQVAVSKNEDTYQAIAANSDLKEEASENNNNYTWYIVLGVFAVLIVVTLSFRKPIMEKMNSSKGK